MVTKFVPSSKYTQLSKRQARGNKFRDSRFSASPLRFPNFCLQTVACFGPIAKLLAALSHGKASSSSAKHALNQSLRSNHPPRHLANFKRLAIERAYR